jgi:hypothetical protein
MGSVATLLTDTRSAFRTKLAETPLPSVSALGLIAAGKTLTTTDMAIDFVEAGFKTGDFVVPGLTVQANGGLRRLVKVRERQLTFATDFAAEEKVGAVALAVPMIDVDWEDEAYTVKPGVPFMDETLAVLESVPKGGGRSGYQTHTVLMTFGLSFPSGQGTVGAESMVGRLLKHFRPGRSIYYGDQAGTIISAQSGPGVKAAPWVRRPIMVKALVNTSD